MKTSESVAAGLVLIGMSDSGPQSQRLDRANRHGLVAGATGTGKTVTLQELAEGFSAAGVPVFAADVKGDLSGVAMAATPNDKLLARAKAIGVELEPHANPVVFWDLFGEKGHPIRTTISEMGPLLLARLLDLSDAQEGVLNIAFSVADKEGLLLLDLDDLGALLSYVAEHAKEIGTTYGNVAPATVGAIQRGLLQLRMQGAEHFFGEPALKLADLMRTDITGRGTINLLAADKLISSPRLYATFLLWLLSELFEELPEIGDPDKPRLVFFFDEAHLLFNEAPKALLEKVEQVVRLIRSKGVGIYFVTQNPADIPDSVLAQLGMRVQHALRAYTPGDQKGLKAAAQSFRTNPAFDTATAIQALGVGEALVSTLDEKGAPTVVQMTRIRPPDSRIGALTDEERRTLIGKSPLWGAYDQAINRESAFERLAQRAEQRSEPETSVPTSREAPAPRPRTAPAPRPSNRQSMAEALAKSVIRSAGSQLGRALIRGVLGSLTR
ncbi:MAG: ATP-binding protein [Caulobacteraceae bacterium]|nr:ATP-binding protein [Caulobacteraceae bacterium]